MNFLEVPTSGKVYIDGKELTSKKKTKLIREYGFYGIPAVQPLDAKCSTFRRKVFALSVILHQSKSLRNQRKKLGE